MAGRDENQDALTEAVKDWMTCACGHSVVWHRFGASSPDGFCEFTGPQSNDGCASECTAFRPTRKED